jgi:hypothetical protein
MGKCSIIYIWFTFWLFGTWINVEKEKKAFENDPWRQKKNWKRVGHKKNYEKHKKCQNFDEIFVAKSRCKVLNCSCWKKSDRSWSFRRKFQWKLRIFRIKNYWREGWFLKSFDW